MEMNLKKEKSLISLLKTEDEWVSKVNGLVWDIEFNEGMVQRTKDAYSDKYPDLVAHDVAHYQEEIKTQYERLQIVRQELSEVRELIAEVIKGM